MGNLERQSNGAIHAETSVSGDDQLNHFCRTENWTLVMGDPSPRAVRWARREDRMGGMCWTKWHYTEGNGAFTACGSVVALFTCDGSPQEGDVVQVNCSRCLSRGVSPGIAIG